MKRTSNPSSATKPILQSPIKKTKVDDPKNFITPPRPKPENILDQQPWSVGGGRTGSSRSENSVHITRNRDFTFPDNQDEVMAANFVAKYKLLKELGDEIEVLRQILSDLNVANKKKKEKNNSSSSSAERHKIADTRSKVSNISLMLEHVFIQLLPKVESHGGIDATLKKIISELNQPDSTEIIATLVTAINKSYENAGNDREKKLASFSNRLQIIKLLNDSEFEYGADNPWSKIHEYNAILLQLNFERELKKLDIHFTPLSKLQNGSTKRTRIVFTDLFTSIQGFKYMQAWFAANPSSSNDIKEALKKAGAVKVSTDPLRPVTLDLEIAWYHLMNTDRHAEENVIFVGQLQSLEYAIKFCTRDSTLVLNAHGGQNELTINKITDAGSKNSILKGQALIDYIKTIVAITNRKITHVILAICATGYLYSDKNIATTDKYTIEDDNTADLRRQKNRKKILIDEDSANNKLETVLGAFGKLSIGTDSIALTFAKFLFSRPDQDQYLGTAFTFSPTIVHPGTAPYGGLIAAPRGLDMNRRDWPDYNTDWNVDSSGLKLQEAAYKSYTLYNHVNNRKAHGEYGTWKKLPNALNLKWKQEHDDSGAFASFEWIIFELIKKKILNNDNKFISYYNNSLISPRVMFNNSGSSAIMHAFTQSIMNDTLNTPFDYDMTLLCHQIVTGHDLSNSNAIGLIPDEFKVWLNKIYAANSVKMSNGVEFYSYLKHKQSDLVTAAKEYYCRNIGATSTKFQARLYDMLYIARKLGCFSEAHEHPDTINPIITRGKQHSRVHVLSDNPSGLTLHIRRLPEKNWQVSTFDIDKQNNIAAQQYVPEYAIMSWPYTSYNQHKSANTGISTHKETGALESKNTTSAGVCAYTL
jgi:hypothetical protein